MPSLFIRLQDLSGRAINYAIKTAASAYLLIHLPRKFEGWSLLPNQGGQI